MTPTQMGVGGTCFPQCGGSWESVWWSRRLCMDLEPEWVPAARRSSVLENREDKPAYLEVVWGKGETQTCGAWCNLEMVRFLQSLPAKVAFPDCQGYREQLLSRILPITWESRSSAGAKHPPVPNCKETLGGMATSLPFDNEVLTGCAFGALGPLPIYKSVFSALTLYF